MGGHDALYQAAMQEKNIVDETLAENIIRAWGNCLTFLYKGYSFTGSYIVFTYRDSCDCICTGILIW